MTTDRIKLEEIFKEIGVQFSSYRNHNVMFDQVIELKRITEYIGDPIIQFEFDQHGKFNKLTVE